MPGPRPTVYVAYDYGCAYSCVGMRRAQRLDEHLDVDWVWIPWEMYPSIPEEGEAIDGVDEPATYPVKGLPGRLADEFGERLYWPPAAPNTEAALRGAKVARREGREAFEAYHERVFEAVWEHGENVGDVDVLASIADQAGLDPETFRKQLDSQDLDEHLEQASEAVERLALSRRPTFVFGDHRIAGTDAFEPSLAKPLEAFVQRFERDGAEAVTTLAEDLELGELLDV